MICCEQSQKVFKLLNYYYYYYVIIVKKPLTQLKIATKELKKKLENKIDQIVKLIEFMLIN